MKRQILGYAVASSGMALILGLLTSVNANAEPSYKNVDGFECTIVGTNRADRLTGTEKDDVICGLGGHDTINSLGGNDVILGGPGNDRINGGAGEDLAIGGAGNDNVIGGGGQDEISGGTGNDRLDGGSGVDTIQGEAGSDVIFGGDDSDSVEGGVGNDVVNGGAGEDEVQGDTGSDRLEGGAGDDLVVGGDGTDQVAGGAGDDHLGGGPGRDTIQAGNGSDICGTDALDTLNGTCSVDNTPPNLINVMGTPVFVAGEEAVFTWSVSDPAGVLGSWLYIGGPSGWVTEWCGFAIEASRIGGTDQEGIFEVRCSIPENAVSQNYTAFVYATDIFGTWNGQMEFEFSVIGGSADSQTPELLDISFNMARVGPSDTLTLTWTASDLSGVKYVVPWLALEGYRFADNSGRSYADSFLQPQELMSGDSFSGTYRQVITFTEFAPNGTYTLWFSVADEVGNRSFFQLPLVVERTS